MEMSPQRIRSAEFKTVRKGADPDEVGVFLNDVAEELERAQNQSAAMEARARAAVARLQEMSDAGASAPTSPAAPADAPEVSVDEAETISRTLLLAQRTADSAVAEARADAARIVQTANDEATTTLDSAREMSERLLEEARTEARRAGDAERVTVAGEVEALKARRDFLESDVEQLELFLADQRARIREAAASIVDVAERVPGGLAEVRPPLLSASDDETPSAVARPSDAADGDDHGDDAGDGDGGPHEEYAADDPSTPEHAPASTSDGAPVEELHIVTDIAENESAAPTDDAPTQAMPAITPRDDADERRQTARAPHGDEDILFSFDDDRL